MTIKQILPEVQLYSDGGANPNPGPGGYGIILSCKGVRKEFSQGYVETTNNRMELTGVITGLAKLKSKSKVEIYTDSQYTINGIEKGWAKKWKQNNWYRTKTQKAVNHDLWEKLLELVEKHDVSFYWVKGHNGHAENERCDELATLAMQKKNLLVDENFIPEEKTNQSKLDIKIEKETKPKTKIDKSIKVEKTGDNCRKCGNPVIKKIPKHTKKTLQKAYYYEYFLQCPSCKTHYMINDAKRDISTLKLS